MSTIDLIFGLLLIIAAWKGYRHGFVIEVASLVALILGIYLAIHFSGYAETLLRERFNLQGQYLGAASFIVTFIVVILAVILVGRLVEKLVNLMLLGFINKLAGVVFSILKYAVVISVVIFLINIFDVRTRIFTEERKQESYLYRPVAEIAPLLLNVFGMDHILERPPKKIEVKPEDQLEDTPEEWI